MHPITDHQAFSASAFRPPSPSLASRMPPLRSAGTARSQLVDPHTNRLLRTESHLETKIALVFLARRDVITVIEQQPVIEYFDERGKLRYHAFDFLVEFADGRRIAYAVKPLKKALKYDLYTKLKRIAPFVPRDIADAVSIMTESTIAPWQITNAKLLHSAARHLNCDIEADTIVHAVVSAATPQTIGQIIERSHLRGRAYRAILRMIVRGELTVQTQGSLDYSAIITLTFPAEATR